MDGKQGPDVALTDSVTVADLARILAGIPAPASAAALIDETRELEDLKSALAARQARDAVAFDLAQRREQSLAGVPADQLGTGVGAQLALARRESPPKAGDSSASPKHSSPKCRTPSPPCCPSRRAWPCTRPSHGTRTLPGPPGIPVPGAS
jgi:hypothetical protein